MKSKILLSTFLAFALAGSVFAQTDSTRAVKDKKYLSGFAIYAEFGLLSNSSFTNIRKSLKAQGVEPFGSLMGSIVLAKRVETDRWVAENRLILMNSTRYNNEVDVERGSLWGVGIGMTAGPKVVNTPKWNVFVPIGFDAMVYKLGIKSNPSASLARLMTNVGTYQAIKLYSASLNLNAGVGVDYKTGFMPKLYDKFYVSTRFSYHLPVATSGQWRGENVQVNDLAKFKPNQLYLSLGFVMVPKASRHKMHGMM